MRACSVEGCGLKHMARGFCAKHYRAAQDAGGWGLCRVHGCNRGRVAKDMCRLHHKRALAGRPIIALADDPKRCPTCGCPKEMLPVLVLGQNEAPQDSRLRRDTVSSGSRAATAIMDALASKPIKPRLTEEQRAAAAAKARASYWALKESDPQALRDKDTKKRRRGRALLTRSYVKKLLREALRARGVVGAEIPDEAIDIWRARMLLERAVNHTEAT